MRRFRGGQPIQRDDLLGALAVARIAIIEAPGGYGKTTLATQLGRSLGCAAVRVICDDGAGPAELITEVRRAVITAGLSDTAAVIDVADDPLVAVFEQLSQRSETTVIIVDEVHRLGADTSAALVRAVRCSSNNAHVLLCGRRIPGPIAELLDDPEVAHVGIDDLRFDVCEVERLLNATIDDASHLARSLHQAVDGWPAAVAVAVSRFEVTLDRAIIRPGTGTALMQRLLADTIAELPSDLRLQLPTLAALPLLARDLVDHAIGDGSFDEFIDSGLPVTQRPDGWSVLADPVREVLAALGSIDHFALGRAAWHMRQVGEIGLAAELVARHLDHTALATFLDHCSLDDFQVLGIAKLAAYITLLDDASLAAHPDVLYHAAIVAETRNDMARRDWLRRAEALTTTSAPALNRRIRAEQLIDGMRFEQPSTVLDSYRLLLDQMGPGESAARGRVLMAAVVAHIMSDEPSSRHALRPMLWEAAELFKVSGMRRWEAEALRRLGYSIELHLGDYERANEAFTRALALLPAPDRDRAMALSYFAEVLETCGRADAAQTALREASDIGHRTGDTRSVWFAAWTSLLMAARVGDRESVDRSIAEIDRAVGPIPEDGNGFEYLVTVADALAGMGDLEGGRRLLDQARPIASRLGRESAVMMVDARLEALDGDPAEAERLLEAIEGTPYAVPEQRWIRLLERAVAVKRSGDLDRAGELAAAALQAAADQGQPDLPGRFEPRLLHLVADLLPTNSSPPESGRRISVLGRCRVTDHSGDISPPPGQPMALVALVAVRGGIDIDEAIDLIWPEIDPSTGRARLRNLLNRVHDRSGEVIRRDGARIVLADPVEVDAAVFEQLADEALAAAGPDRCGLARHALAHWSGELLPDQRFDDWTLGPRERLKRRHLSLLDIVIEDSISRDDFDDAVRHLELAIEHEPLDEERHVRVVEVLLRQGRRAAAAAGARPRRTGRRRSRGRVVVGGARAPSTADALTF